jgi:hypothetical protein
VLLAFFALLIALFLFGRALLNGSSHMTSAPSRGFSPQSSN